MFKKALIILLAVPLVFFATIKVSYASTMGGYGNDFVSYYSVLTNDNDWSFGLYYNETGETAFQSSPLRIQGTDYEIVPFLDILNSMFSYWGVLDNKQVDYYIDSGKNYTYFANYDGGELVLQSYDLIYISISRFDISSPYNIVILGYVAGIEPIEVYAGQHTIQQLQFLFVDYGIYAYRIAEGGDSYILGYNSGYSIGDSVGYNRGYNVGLNEGASIGNDNVFDMLITGLFGFITVLANIEILPGLKIAYIAGIIIVFGMIGFLIGKGGKK